VLPPSRGTVIRAYSSRGLYWKEPVALESALYVNEGDLIFTACHYDDSWQETSDFYSELELLKVEEVRLLSSLLLPIHFDGGLALFHPMPQELLVAETPKFDSQEVQDSVSRQLRAALSAKVFDHYDYLSLPPMLDERRRYDYRELSLPTALQKRLHSAVNVDDHLLIRGLYGLIRCSMLLNYRMFLEEATLALYVSLDASFELVIRLLSQQGHVNPSSYDAGAWMAAAFKEEYFNNRYFEEYYDDRIRTLHPKSRFGIFPFAPLAADDCYYLLKGLREVYKLLILGEVVGPE